MFNFASLGTIVCKCCCLTLPGLIYYSVTEVMHHQVTQTSQMGLSVCLCRIQQNEIQNSLKKLTVKFRGKPSIKLWFLPLIFALEPDYVAHRILWRKILGLRILSSDSKFMTEYMPKRELSISQKIVPIENTQTFVVFWLIFTDSTGVNIFAKCVSP